jgi:hypothetical protein
MRPVDDGNGKSVQICPGSLVPVNEEECRELGVRQGAVYGGVTEASEYAPGCFNHAAFFYYNNHSTGMRGADGPLWCKDPDATGEHRHLHSISWKSENVPIVVCVRCCVCVVACVNVCACVYVW